MCDQVCEKASSSDPGTVEYDTTQENTYHTPRSNSYSIPRSNTYNTPRSKVDAKEDHSKMASNFQESGPEPVYATPDEMNIITNKAYVASGTYALQTVHPETNVYSIPDDAIPDDVREKETAVYQREPSRVPCCCKCIIVLVCTVLIFLAIGTAIAALAMVLYNSYIKTPCDCTPTHSSQITEALSFIESRLNQTSKALEQSQSQVRMLSSQFTQLSENVTNAAVVPTPEPVNISNLLHNCTSTIEAQCTVEPLTGSCVTQCVEENKPNSVAVSFQCQRLESDEVNPLLGVLDVSNGLALCICYVLEIDGQHRTHHVECVLKVTRCSLVNLNV